MTMLPVGDKHKMHALHVHGIMDLPFLDFEESKSDYDMTNPAEDSTQIASLSVTVSVSPSQSSAPPHCTENKAFVETAGENNSEAIVKAPNAVEPLCAGQVIENYSEIEKDDANFEDSSSFSSEISGSEQDEHVKTDASNEQDFLKEERQKARFRAIYMAGFRAASKVREEQCTIINTNGTFEQGLGKVKCGIIAPTGGVKHNVQDVQSDIVTSETPIQFVNETNNAVLSSSRPALVHSFSDSSVGSNGGGPIDPQRASGNVAFPRKLMDMLLREDPSVVSFLSSGQSFLIQDQDIFISMILPKYFRHAKLTSFQRQLNLYGFRRITKGPEAGAYHHPLFHRDQPDMCLTMRRTKQKHSTELKSPSTAPSDSPRIGRRIWRRSPSDSCVYSRSCGSTIHVAGSSFKFEMANVAAASGIKTDTEMSNSHSMSPSSSTPRNKGLTLLLNNPNLKATRSSMTARLLGRELVPKNAAFPTGSTYEPKIAQIGSASTLAASDVESIGNVLPAASMLAHEVEKRKTQQTCTLDPLAFVSNLKTIVTAAPTSTVENEKYLSHSRENNQNEGNGTSSAGDKDEMELEFCALFSNEYDNA